MTHALPLALVLRRIGLNRLPPADVPGLFDLVRAFRTAIPFENLDVLAGRPASCSIGAIVRKIVLQKRGGWCYELNQLMAETLRCAGYEVHRLMARVGYRRPTLGPLAHLLLQVRVGGRAWLVDVGFGGPGPSEPLLDETGEITCADGSRFRLEDPGEGVRLLSRQIEGEWERLYAIEPMLAHPIDLEMASHFLATWEHSPFRRQFMCVAHADSSNWSLEGLDLVQRDATWAAVDRTPIRDWRHLQLLLAHKFDIDLPVPMIEQVWRATNAAQPAS